MTGAQITKFAEDYFAANFHNSEIKDLALTASYTPSGPSVTISATGKLPTDFMGIIGTESVDHRAVLDDGVGRGEAARRPGARHDRVDVVLRQDDRAQDGDPEPADPAQGRRGRRWRRLRVDHPVQPDVNAGSSNYAQTWVSWTDWEAEPSFTKPSNWAQIGPGSSCPFPSSGWGSTYGFKCTNRPATAERRLDDVDGSKQRHVQGLYLPEHRRWQRFDHQGPASTTTAATPAPPIPAAEAPLPVPDTPIVRAPAPARTRSARRTAATTSTRGS